MNFTGNLFDFFKLPIKIMGALSIASGIILFLPDSIIKRLYIVSFREKYGFTIGIIFIVTISILLVSLIVVVYKFFLNIYRKKKFEENAPKRLKSLTQYQKAIIYDLYIEDNYTDEIPLNDGAVIILENNLMISKAASQYMVEDLNDALYPYMLQPWVINRLNSDNEMKKDFQIAYECYDK